MMLPSPARPRSPPARGARAPQAGLALLPMAAPFALVGASLRECRGALTRLWRARVAEIVANNSDLVYRPGADVPLLPTPGLFARRRRSPKLGALPPAPALP